MILRSKKSSAKPIQNQRDLDIPADFYKKPPHLSKIVTPNMGLGIITNKDIQKDDMVVEYFARFSSRKHLCVY